MLLFSLGHLTNATNAVVRGIIITIILSCTNRCLDEGLVAMNKQRNRESLSRLHYNILVIIPPLHMGKHCPSFTHGAYHTLLHTCTCTQQFMTHFSVKLPAFYFLNRVWNVPLSLPTPLMNILLHTTISLTITRPKVETQVSWFQQ